MKKILKTSIFAFLAIALASCENEKDTVAIAQGGTKLLTPSSGTNYVLNPLNASSTTVTTLVWEQSENGIPTAANYTIQLAKAGTNFATPLNAGTTNNRFASWTAEQLNGVLSSDPTILPYVPQTMNLRIKSSIGSAANAVIQYSNVISITVTPYSLALPKLGVPGNHQGWTPSNAATLPLLAASAYGKTNFEGYASLNGEFKFLNPKPNGTFDWGGDADDWADDGTFSGTLVNLGGSNCTATTGYYLIKANTGVTTTANPGGLAYSTTLITTWGVIGDATPNGWGASTAMTYNATTKKWSITLPLTGAKQFKFRANNDWGINLGKFDASKTGNAFGGDDMSYDGGNIDVATAGTYTITLDLSNPRAYKYTVN